MRAVLNVVNLSTPLGLLLARVGGARPERGPRDTWLAPGWRPRFPDARAFTVGSVVLTRHDAVWLRSRPALLRHEDVHVTQYAWLLGLPLLPLYLLAAGVSWVVAADHSSWNPFERLAGLQDGGYPEARVRRGRRG